MSLQVDVAILNFLLSWPFSQKNCLPLILLPRISRVQAELCSYLREVISLSASFSTDSYLSQLHAIFPLGTYIVFPPDTVLLFLISCALFLVLSPTSSLIVLFWSLISASSLWKFLPLTLSEQSRTQQTFHFCCRITINIVPLESS